MKGKKGKMVPMEYGLIRFASEDSYVVEDILIVLSRFLPVRPMKGYAVEVADSLRGGLSFIDGDDGAAFSGEGPLFSLSRVYVNMDDAGGSVLIAAESMNERARWISSEWKPRSGKNFNGVILHAYPQGQWNLVGITAPGWMVLFDETAEEAEQDWLDMDVHVAYLPPEERVLDSLSPDRSSAEVISLLMEYLLSCLPMRDSGL